MLRKLLIANRGEIAVRIIRTARRLRIATVAVYSDADEMALHTSLADEAVFIGGSPATESYLDVDRIVAAALATGADGIHPGYGFLSENPALAEACAAAGIAFVGPSAEAMRQLGDKAAAKALAMQAGIPTVPGYDGAKQDQKNLIREAQRIGFPLLVKALAGGGGRGLRVVDDRAAFADALASAVREATSAFGDGRVLLERLVRVPRHVEVQVFGDAAGNVVHLFERDCSLQRRHQKVIEEAPAPGMSRELRAALTGAAVKLAEAAGYIGAGTVEFLIEGGSLAADATWYFIEMNTRLQVEHPVTEAVTGLDLVEWQLRVAGGERLPLRQEEIALSGHAVEARLYAEDPAHGFRPSIGTLIACELPTGKGVRVDTGVRAGDTVTAFYDPMIAKVIAAGADRRQALDRLATALHGTWVAGPQTNAAFLAALVEDIDVRGARLDTGLIGRRLEQLAPSAVDGAAVSLGTSRLIERRQEQHHATGPWGAGDGFQLGATRHQEFDVVANGSPVRVGLTWGSAEPVVIPKGMSHLTPGMAVPRVIDGDDCVHVLAGGRQTTISWPDYASEDAAADADGRSVVAPITGRIAKLFVAAGDEIAKGDRIAIVEAMKMEYVLHAGGGGRVGRLHAGLGAQVTQGAIIAEIEPGEAPHEGKRKS